MKKYISEILSFVLLALGIWLRSHATDLFPFQGAELLYFLIAFLPVGVPVVKEAWECICEKEFFNEFTLMVLASIGAFYIGEYPEGVAVMLFYSVGEKLQDRAVSRARGHIRSLLDVRPETARVVSADGQTDERSPEAVRPGDTVEVRPGERVPLDGVLLTPHATFDTAALTGESMPRLIERDGEVLAGMIVTDTPARFRVSRPAGESALARILQLVEEASARKAPAELFIRRFARVYTPTVTLLAALVVLLPYIYSLFASGFTYVFDDWLYRGLVFLVISCPCALVVSIPLGYFGGIGAASRQGILFKGGNYLDAITRIDSVVFDKTGTLTKGEFEVSEIHATTLSEEGLLELVASMEQHSNHPIAQAIVRTANERRLPLQTFPEEKEMSGLGIRTTSANGHTYLAGNSRLLRQEGISYPETVDEMEETVILCTINGHYEGYLVLSDTVKADSAAAIQALKDLKIDNIQMLSGDKQGIVSKFAGQLGVRRAYGNLLPEGKVAHLKELKDHGHRVAFVGDGMNDAPVLALSDVGIAMGGLGSDAAIETADVVIQTDQPGKVATALRIGRRTRQIIWQNITFALGIKIIILLLGVLGFANLWAAVFADVGVAMLAICNALRIQLGKYDTPLPVRP